MSFIGPARPTTTTTSNEIDKDTINNNNNDKKRLIDNNINCKNTNTNNDSNETLSVEPPPKRLMVGPKLTDSDSNNIDNNKDNEILSPQPPTNKRVMGPTLDDDNDNINNNNKATLGPQPPTTTNKRVMGPRLNDDNGRNSNNETTVGPQLPQKRVMGPRLDDDNDSNKITGPQIPSRNRVMGPSIGPSFNKDDSSSDDDEDKNIKSEWERVRNDNNNNNDGNGGVKVSSKREEWMTQLPTGRIDSTSNRQFSQKGNVSKPIIGPGLTNNNDEVDDKKKVFEKLRQKETEEKMRSYNDKNRSESLLSMHAQKNKQSNSQTNTTNTTGKKEFSFNRDEELKIGTVDKEHLNNIVRGSTSLNDKFGKSNWM